MKIVLLRLTAALVIALLVAAPAAWAGACGGSEDSCCCPSAKAPACDTVSAASCGCVVESGEAPLPAPAAPARDVHPPALGDGLAHVPASAVAATPARLGAEARTPDDSSPPRLYLRHGVFRC